MIVIEVASGNEVDLVLLIPSTVIIKADLVCFVKSCAKWEVLPHAVCITYVNEVNEESVCDAENGWQIHPKMHRALLRVMLPTVSRYELRFHWGLAPAECSPSRSVISQLTPDEHPLRIALEVGEKVPNFRPLVPSIYHPTAKRFGYPLKHPLAEHCGVMLLGPTRYRLRMGYVRFSVYVRQGKPALREKDAYSAGAAAVAAQETIGENTESPTACNREDTPELDMQWGGGDAVAFSSRQVSQMSTAGSMSVLSGNTGRTSGAVPTSRAHSRAGSDACGATASDAGDAASSASVSNRGARLSPDVRNHNPDVRLDPRVHFEDKNKAEESDESNEDMDAQMDGYGSKTPTATEDADMQKEVLLEDVQRRVKRQLSRQIRRGTAGQICIVAVVGSWRRVELLRRRPLEPPIVPAATIALAATEGSAIAAAAASFAVTQDAEIHEAILNITDEDQAQPVQLLAFQIGAADAFENLSNHGEAEANAATPSGNRRAPRGNDFGTITRQRPGHPAQLGMMSTPSRWCIAEFLVEGAHPLPFDEDEMEKPLPPPRDPLELIGFVGKDDQDNLMSNHYVSQPFATRT
jgi:hypothetical protein